MPVAYKPPEKVRPIYSSGAIVPPKFISNYYEFIRESNYTEIYEDAGATNTTNTIYTVPDGYTFYLISATLSIKLEDAARTDSYGYLRRATSVNDNLIVLHVNANYHDGAVYRGSSSVSTSYPLPLKVRSGESLTVKSDHAGVQAYCCVQGFLVKNSNLPKIF